MNKQKNFNIILKLGLIFTVIIAIIYVVFYNFTYNSIADILTIFSPDGIVQEHTTWKFYFVILLDILIVIFLFYYLQEYKKFNTFWNILIIGLIIEIFIMQLIFLFDRGYCPGENYSLKWPTAVQLLLASFFAYRNF